MTQDRLPIVFAAPHRLAFLVATLNLIGLALWWAVKLATLHLELPALPEGDVPAVLLHGPGMLYLVYPPFVFGFLLTVFPRWMGFADLTARTFGPVSTLLAAGSLMVHAALWSGADALLLQGFATVALGWALGMLRLGGVLAANGREGRAVCWHAWSAMAALALGLAGLLAVIAFLVSLDARAWLVGNRLGLTGFALPVFLTVAHRMVPFFAGNVVKGYAMWRPYWLLAAMWGLLAVRLVSIHSDHQALAIGANSGLFGLTGLMLWKWWPRGEAPGLLKVLFWALLWAPAGFAMAVGLALGLPLGRGSDHALFIGFAGSLVVAMVTRVTQGHSGRPLEMPRQAWIAFFALQFTAVLRIGAAIDGESGRFLLVAAGVLVLGLAPWIIRHAAIYLRARLDGKAG